MAMAQLKSGLNEVVIAGGMESNSLQPHRFYAKNDPRYTDGKAFLTANFNPQSTQSLAQSAEQLAHAFQITKDEMWDWVLESHHRAADFIQTAIYKRHVIDYDRKGPDQTVRVDLKREDLVRWSTKETIDRTNTAHYHDGAAVLVLGTEELGRRLDKKPMACIRDILILGVDPDEAPKGVIYGASELLEQHALKAKDIDIFEVNESFACKPLSFAKHFGLSDKKYLNVFGGNLAYGHPFAASGTMNLLHLILALKEKKQTFGLLSAGVAGGYGAAMLVENCE